LEFLLFRVIFSIVGFSYFISIGFLKSDVENKTPINNKLINWEIVLGICIIINFFITPGLFDFNKISLFPKSYLYVETVYSFFPLLLSSIFFYLCFFNRNIYCTFLCIVSFSLL
jgi:hypothetical protein